MVKSLSVHHFSGHRTAIAPVETEVACTTALQRQQKVQKVWFDHENVGFEWRTIGISPWKQWQPSEMLMSSHQTCLKTWKKITNVCCGYIGSRFLMIEKQTTGEAFEPLGGDQESGPKTAAANLPSRYLARHKKGGKFLAKKSHWAPPSLGFLPENHGKTIFGNSWGW